MDAKVYSQKEAVKIYVKDVNYVGETHRYTTKDGQWVELQRGAEKLTTVEVLIVDGNIIGDCAYIFTSKLWATK